MRKKLKVWQKTLISYVSFLLIIGIIAYCFVALAVSPEKKYGISAGAIRHSKTGTDITNVVLNGSTNEALLENGRLAFAVTDNGNITVTDKSTGKIWSSAVVSGLENRFGQGLAETQSLFTVTYVNDKNAEAEWTSYEQAVQKKQLEVYRLSDDTVRLDFILGESTTDRLIPSAFTKERFENDILPQLDEDDRDFLKRQYTLYEPDRLTAKDNPDALYKQYPALKKTALYIAGNIDAKITRQKLTAVFEKIGYTDEDYVKDNELTGFSTGEVDFTYKIALDFTLQDNALVVNIPKDEIVFYTQNPMLKISLMKFLTSATQNSAVLVPSGSGAVAEFRLGQSQRTYRDPVYGRDLTVNQKTLPDTMDQDSSITFPMYAMRVGSDVVTAIIESGQASAALNYNTTADGMYCYYDFTVLQSDKAYIDVKNSVIQCGNDSISEDITVRYVFGSADADRSDDEVFSQAAVTYREYLRENGMLPENQTVSEDPSLLLELLGSVTVKKDMLGLFPVNTDLVMTDFDGAAEIVEWFSANTDAPLAVKLSGWNKGGLYRQTPGKITFLESLGGQKGYEAFRSLLADRNISLYYSAEHTAYLNPSWLGGYQNSFSAMFVDGSIAERNTYNAVEGAGFGDGVLRIISASKYAGIAEDYTSGNIKAFSIGVLGNSLNSDYNSPYYDRTRVQAEVLKALRVYQNSGSTLSAADANDYALAFCSRLENVSATAGKSSVFTRSFPLKQMILHGAIDYTVKADFGFTEVRETVLNAIRTGSGLYATLSYQNSDYVFPAYYSDIYSSDYADTRSAIAESASLAYSALSGLGDVEIVSYEARGEVTKTVYANGAEIYVNTGSVDASFDTVEVEAMSYLRINH